LEKELGPVDKTKNPLPNKMKGKILKKLVKAWASSENSKVAGVSKEKQIHENLNILKYPQYNPPEKETKGIFLEDNFDPNKSNAFVEWTSEPIKEILLQEEEIETVKVSMNSHDEIVFDDYEISTFISSEDQLKVIQAVNEDFSWRKQSEHLKKLKSQWAKKETRSE